MIWFQLYCTAAVFCFFILAANFRDCFFDEHDRKKYSPFMRLIIITIVSMLWMLFLVLVIVCFLIEGISRSLPFLGKAVNYIAEMIVGK